MTHRPSRRDRLPVIFAFLVFFGAAMFLVSPDPNRADPRSDRAGDHRHRGGSRG
jgi:hypothetical protein